MDDEIDVAVEEEPAELPSFKPYLAITTDGVVTQATHTNAPTDGWVEVSEEDFTRVARDPHIWRYVNGVLESFTPPQSARPTVLPKLELYRRMTDEEYEKMQGGVATQSARIQDVFRMVDNFRSNDTLWPLLNSMGEQLFGAERTAELLAPL